MRFDGQILVLEGREVNAYNALAMRLVEGMGIQPAIHDTWAFIPGLDMVSRNSVCSAVFRMFSHYIVIQTLDSRLHPIEVLEEATKRAGIALEFRKEISHKAEGSVEPAPASQIAELSGTARLRPKWRMLGLSR